MKIIIHQKPRKIKLTIKQLKALMNQICDDLSLLGGQISFVFAADDIISSLHAEYLNDDSPTDVITFNLNEDGMEGEIYIGWEMAVKQADHYKVALEQEILRLMIHGILHLAGMNDHTEDQQTGMREEEDRLLSLINQKDLY